MFVLFGTSVSCTFPEISHSLNSVCVCVCVCVVPAVQHPSPAWLYSVVRPLLRCPLSPSHQMPLNHCMLLPLRDPVRQVSGTPRGGLHIYSLERVLKLMWVLMGVS